MISDRLYKYLELAYEVFVLESKLSETDDLEECHKIDEQIVEIISKMDDIYNSELYQEEAEFLDFHLKEAYLEVGKYKRNALVKDKDWIKRQIYRLYW